MASLEDRASHGHSAPGSSDVEFLPLIADVVGWVGLLLCAVGFVLLLGEGLEQAVYGLYETTPASSVGVERRPESTDTKAPLLRAGLADYGSGAWREHCLC